MTFRPDAAAGPKTERSPGGFGRLRSTGEGGLRSQDRLAIRRKTRCGRYFQGAFGQWVAVHVGNRTGSVDPGCVGDPQVTRPDGDCHRVGYHFKSSLIGASDMACTRKKPGTDGNPTLFRHGGPGFHSPVSASACSASASAGIGGRGEPISPQPTRILAEARHAAVVCTSSLGTGMGSLGTGMGGNVTAGPAPRGRAILAQSIRAKKVYGPEPPLKRAFS